MNILFILLNCSNTGHRIVLSQKNTDERISRISQGNSIKNNTTGSFSLTFTTGVVGGTTVTLPQTQTIIVICDGTNVYNAQTATSSSFTTLTLGNGSAALPSLNFAGDTTTGLYLPTSGKLGFAVGGVSAGYISAAGMRLPVGVSGGEF